MAPINSNLFVFSFTIYKSLLKRRQSLDIWRNSTFFLNKNLMYYYIVNKRPPHDLSWSIWNKYSPLCSLSLFSRSGTLGSISPLWNSHCYRLRCPSVRLHIRDNWSPAENILMNFIIRQLWANCRSCVLTQSTTCSWEVLIIQYCL